jgi:hypothetical protein
VCKKVVLEFAAKTSKFGLFLRGLRVQDTRIIRHSR